MTSREEAVRRARVPLTALHEMLMAELVEDIDRVTLAASDPARGLLISDYLVSLVTTIESNIEQLLFHANRYDQKCYAHETEFRMTAQAYAKAGGVGVPPQTAQQVARTVAIDAHQTSFVVTAGSILDNLAALTIGVGGFDTKLVKADIEDIRRLMPTEDNKKSRAKQLLPEGSPGRDIQDQVIEAFTTGLDTGPTGWADWLLDYRNTLVHRASRIQTVHFQDRSLHRVMPRDPARTQIEAMRRSDDRNVDLTEDARKTINGLATSLADCVRIVSRALVTAWDDRRATTGVIPQPDGQWPELRAPRPRTFDGYDPGTIAAPTPGAALHVHPNLSKRFKAGQLFDGASDVWAEWIPDD